MKKIILFFTFLIIGSALISKNVLLNKTNSSKEVRITFIRCNNFSLKYMKDVQNQLEKYLYNEFGLIAVIDFDEKSEILNSKKRFKAVDVIKYFDNYKFPLTIIFIPDDIEYNKKGILGLSIHPGNTCVVSSFRVKNPKNLWKITAHEFIHTYFDYSHCPNDNPKCLMKDAKGHVYFNNKNTICNKCKINLLTKINF